MPAIEDLVTEFARLPGIGRKTAQRLTFHLLQQSPEQAGRLAAALTAVADRVRPCTICGTPTEADLCEYCLDPRRDATIVCVVEEPSAVGVLDRATGFRGRYHVLGGRLDPLAGVGPEALRLDELKRRVAEEGVREIILATNPSMEGEVTATYIQQLLAGSEVRVTRLARGLPVGGDLEYVDGVTLAHALTARQEVR
ncbi:MAG TPA: recombination mediator RecR [Gemmatimonadales bacterium]|nr:recombination mediator RecR [Gemmatimonadales bacterium]